MHSVKNDRFSILCQLRWDVTAENDPLLIHREIGETENETEHL